MCGQLFTLRIVGLSGGCSCCQCPGTPTAGTWLAWAKRRIQTTVSLNADLFCITVRVRNSKSSCRGLGTMGIVICRARQCSRCSSCLNKILPAGSACVGGLTVLLSSADNSKRNETRYVLRWRRQKYHHLQTQLKISR